LPISSYNCAARYGESAWYLTTAPVLVSTGVDVAPLFNSTEEADQRLQAISEERGAGDDDVPF